MSRRHSTRRFEKAGQPILSTATARRPNRKTLQLCGQVKEALSWVLGSTTRDSLIHCHVESVEPLPGGNRMLVKVAVPLDFSLINAATELQSVHIALRREVAQSINRRKVPELLFIAVRASE